MANENGLHLVGVTNGTTGEGYNVTGIIPVVFNVASQLSPEWLGYCLFGCTIFILFNKLIS